MSKKNEKIQEILATKTEQPVNDMYSPTSVAWNVFDSL